MIGGHPWSFMYIPVCVVDMGSILIQLHLVGRGGCQAYSLRKGQIGYEKGTLDLLYYTILYYTILYYTIPLYREPLDGPANHAGLLLKSG